MSPKLDVEELPEGVRIHRRAWGRCDNPECGYKWGPGAIGADCTVCKKQGRTPGAIVAEDEVKFSNSPKTLEAIGKAQGEALRVILDREGLYLPLPVATELAAALKAAVLGERP